MDEILNLIESVSEGFLSYFSMVGAAITLAGRPFQRRTVNVKKDPFILVFIWLSLVMSIMVSFWAVFFPTRYLG